MGSLKLRVGKPLFGLLGVIAGLGLAGVTAGAAASGPPPPEFAKSVDATPAAGQVFFTVPGGSKAALTSARQVPVGTAFDARRGTVGITASDGNGGTYSGAFGKGSFRVLQSASGQGATEIKLLGNPCPSSTAQAADPSGASSAAADAGARHRAPAYRQLQISSSGNFLVVGTNASAVASGQAKYSLVDACNGTRIVDQSGKVTAQRKNAPPKTLYPGQKEVDYCHPLAKPDYCLIVIESPRTSAYSFGLGLAHPRASSFKLCYRTPTAQKHCFKGALNHDTVQFGFLACTINDGPGQYPFRYFVNGQPLGIQLSFKTNRQRQVFLGNDSCQSKASG